jgi:A/G-specific adenine glycosylase
LGYYHRARNLRAAAACIVADYGGRIPGELEALRGLPGVGDYTAAALGSIVHGLPKGVVDGNVIRVLARLARITEPVERSSSRRRIAALADTLVDPTRPGDWNQAIMELGATVCVPRAPRCLGCPWRRSCAGRRAGDPETLPAKKADRPPRKIERAVAVARRRDAVWLVRRRDPRLLDGTWEFPGIDVPTGSDSPAALRAHLRRLLGGGVEVGPEIGRVNHSITHRRITIRAFEVSRVRDAGLKAAGGRWVKTSEVPAYPVSSMTTKLLRALAKKPRG